MRRTHERKAWVYIVPFGEDVEMWRGCKKREDEEGRRWYL
jgi:hypothetical protein